MTFSCQYYNDKTDDCLRLKRKCVLGRKGCILEGRITLNEAQIKRLQELNEQFDNSD